MSYLFKEEKICVCDMKRNGKKRDCVEKKFKQKKNRKTVMK